MRQRLGIAAAPAGEYALVTGDDERSLAVAAGVPGVRAQPAPAGGLIIAADRDGLDALVLALGDARVPVRRLEPRLSALESMFFALTGGDPHRADTAPSDAARAPDVGLGDVDDMAAIAVRRE